MANPKDVGKVLVHAISCRSCLQLRAKTVQLIPGCCVTKRTLLLSHIVEPRVLGKGCFNFKFEGLMGF